MASIIFSCYSLFLIPTDSFSESVCSLLNNLIGQQKEQNFSLLLRRTIVLNYSIIIPVLLFTLLFPETILAIFSVDTKIVIDSINSLNLVTVAVILAVPGEAFYSALVGTGDTRVILTIQIIVTVITLLIAYISAFALALDFEYILLAEVFGWLVCLFLSWLWFKSGLWQRLNI